MVDDVRIFQRCSTCNSTNSTTFSLEPFLPLLCKTRTLPLVMMVVLLIVVALTRTMRVSMRTSRQTQNLRWARNLTPITKAVVPIVTRKWGTPTAMPLSQQYQNARRRNRRYQIDVAVKKAAVYPMLLVCTTAWTRSLRVISFFLRSSHSARCIRVLSCCGGFSDDSLRRTISIKPWQHGWRAEDSFLI